MGKHEVEAKPLSKKQKFWSGHVMRCQASPGTIKDYATAQGLSLRSLYSWRRELMRQDLLGDKSPPRARFSQVVISDALAAFQCRISLPNGVTVDWEEGDLQTMESVLRTAAALP